MDVVFEDLVDSILRHTMIGLSSPFKLCVMLSVSNELLSGSSFGGCTMSGSGASCLIARRLSAARAALAAARALFH